MRILGSELGAILYRNIHMFRKVCAMFGAANNSCMYACLEQHRETTKQRIMARGLQPTERRPLCTHEIRGHRIQSSTTTEQLAHTTSHLATPWDSRTLDGISSGWIRQGCGYWSKIIDPHDKMFAVGRSHIRTFRIHPPDISGLVSWMEFV